MLKSKHYHNFFSSNYALGRQQSKCQVFPIYNICALNDNLYIDNHTMYEGFSTDVTRPETAAQGAFCEGTDHARMFESVYIHW